MSTKQLAIYLFVFITLVGILFGVVPSLLNAANSFINAVGAAFILAALVAAILTAHATYIRGAQKPQSKPGPVSHNKEEQK